MTNYGRNRSARFIKMLPIDALGPNFFRNFKVNSKAYFKTELDRLISFNYHSHDLLDSNYKILKEANDPNLTEIAKEYGEMHSNIERHTLIESMILIDSYIGQFLNQYQKRILELPREDMRDYSEPDNGINACLKGVKTSSEFDKSRMRIKHFRALRNQFAHYKIGYFFFRTTHESFESFLRQLKGIDLGKSEFCSIDGKPGVFLTYRIVSGEFISEFYQDAIKFISLLLETLFIDDESK